MSEFYKGLRLPLAEQGKLLMLNEDNEIISSQITENDVLNRTKLATTAPENPVEGDIYFDAANDKIMAYTGTAWVMQDRILNVTTDYEGTYAGSDCFHVNVQGNIVAGETTFYVMFHRDANGIGNLDIAPGSYGALYLCNPDGTRIVASDVKEGMIVECIVKDTGGVPKYRAYLTQPLHHIANDLKGGSGYVLSAEQGKILNEKIDTTKTELETNITNVETTLTQRIEESSGGLSGDITELETRLDTKIEEAEATLNAGIEANKTAIENNDADILDLQGKVGVNTTDIANLNTKVDEAVEGIEKDIAEVEERVTTNETNIANNTTAINERVTKTDAQPFIKDITYDAETCTFTFTAYDNSTKVFDLPLESAVKSGYYDEEYDNLVLVLMDGTEIKIPAAALIDIYVGSEGNQIKVEVSQDNVISAILKADSVGESFLTPELRERLTTIEAGIKANKEDIATLNENAALYDVSGDLPFRKDAILKINQKLLGSNPDGSTHVLAATLGWNIGTDEEYIQNEFGSSTIHTNLNSIDRPTIEMPTGKEEIAYKSELETAQGDIEAVKDEVKEIVDTEVASLKEKDTAIETEIADLKTADSTLQETITTLEGKVEEADNEIKSTITTLESKVDESVEDLTSGISQNTAAIEATNTTLDEHIAEFETFKTENATALEGYVEKAYIGQHNNGGGFNKSIIDLLNPTMGTAAGFTFHRALVDGTRGDSGYYFNYLLDAPNSDITFTYEDKGYTGAGYSTMYHHLEVKPENVTFDALDSGLESTKLAPAVRELKGLVDTNTTSITNLTTAVEGIENVLDTKLEPIEARITENETNITNNTKAIEDNATAIAERVTKTEAEPFIKDVTFDNTTFTLTFTNYKGETQTFDLPLESTVQGGRYDDATKALILVLQSGDEISIPVNELCDVYTGVDGNDIKVTIHDDNSIEATIKERTIAKSNLLSSLQEEIEDGIKYDDLKEIDKNYFKILSSNVSVNCVNSSTSSGLTIHNVTEATIGLIQYSHAYGTWSTGLGAGIALGSTDKSIYTTAVEDDSTRVASIGLQVNAENVAFSKGSSGLTSTKLAPAIRELKGLVDTNTTNIADITTRVDNVESIVDTKLEPIEARISANETNIATNTQSILDLVARDSELETSITTNVETLNTAIATNRTELDTEIATLKEKDTELEGLISANTTDIENLEESKQNKLPQGNLVSSVWAPANTFGVKVRTIVNLETGTTSAEDLFRLRTISDAITLTAATGSTSTWQLNLVSENIDFDAQESGLTSLKVPAAIREVKGLIDTNATNLTTLTERVATAETAITTNANNITANTTAINERVTKAEAKTFIKDVEYNGETCTFTFTMYDDTVETFDLPLENAVKNGYYDAEGKNLVLVLMNDTEIKIPALDLIDVYTGKEGNQINVSVSSDNVIEAILKADSIDESFLTEALRNRLTTIETGIADNKTALETVNTTLGNHTTEIAGIQEALANISMEASAITFDNTDTDLTATNVQEALVEINNKIGDILTILEEINGTQYENVNEEVF